jgi:hypothetical protein
MYGIDELKNRIKVSGESVECPVKGCLVNVERQKRAFKREDRFRCPQHGIYISPSTFEYEEEQDNLLWKDQVDLRLLEKIRGAKHECRMARDNSEDAVTWNVFRFLEKYNLTGPVLASVLETELTDPELIYWSFSQTQGKCWSELEEGRRAFGENIRTGSEPDVIVKADDRVLFIEAKLTSGNETRPSKGANPEGYENGANGWYSEVFTSPFRSLAIEEKKYELLRFWLIGSWMAKRNNLDFALVNLVRSGQEEDIEEIFGRHLRHNSSRRFRRITWEDIYGAIKDADTLGAPKNALIHYFENKSLGYDTKGMLQKAFQI